MKKSITGFLSCLSAILILLTLSCSMDLEPAKAGNTSVSFTIGTLLPPADVLVLPDSPSARAVAPGLGYLYIRTIGGPTGSKGPFYGPFPLASGDSFTTTSIPAGTYEGIGVLYATERLTDLTMEWEDEILTFAQLMSLPDDEFKLLTDSPEESETPSHLDTLLDGIASAEMVSPVTITANRNNPLTLTLVPVCGSSSITMSDIPENNIYTETGDPDRIIRKFIELEGIEVPAGYTIENLTCTISAAASPYIGRIAMFDKQGDQVPPTFTINDTITTDRELTVPWTGDNTYYLYIEYRASSISLAFSSDMEPIAVEDGYITLNIAAGSGNGNHKAFAYILSVEALENPELVPFAFTVMDLDATGSGYAVFMDVSTGQAYVFSPGEWLIVGFIDNGDYYAGYSTMAQYLSIIDTIESHTGDVTFVSTITTDGTSTSTLIDESMMIVDTPQTILLEVNVGATHAGDKLLAGIYPYTGEDHPDGTPVAVTVIDLDANGVGTGTLVTTGTTDDHEFGAGAWTLTAFIDTNNNYPDILVNNPLTTIVGIEPHLDDYTFQTTLTTDGLGPMSYGISASNLEVCGTHIYYLAQTAAGTGDGQRTHNAMAYGLFFDTVLPTVMTGEEVHAYIVEDIALTYHYINLSSPYPTAIMSVDPSQPRSFLLDGDSSFTVGMGSMVVLRDITLDGQGLSGYYPLVTVDGALSLDKGATLRGRTNTTGNAGGIATQDGATVIMNGLTLIEECHSYGSGGGVYLNGADNNTTFTMTGGTIRNCSADFGGGVSAYGSNAAITMSGGTIENCEALSFGGGIALASNAKLQLSDSALITTTNTTPPGGWGLYCEYGDYIYITPDPFGTDVMNFFSPQTDFFMEQIG